MDRTRALPKIRDAEKESMFGYVYAVSGPGKYICFSHIICDMLWLVENATNNNNIMTWMVFLFCEVFA